MGTGSLKFLMVLSLAMSCLMSGLVVCIRSHCVEIYSVEGGAKRTAKQDIALGGLEHLVISCKASYHGQHGLSHDFLPIKYFKTRRSH